MTATGARPDPAPVAWWTLLSSTVACVALVGGWVLAAAVQPAGYDAVRQTISALAAGDASHRWLMTTAFVVVGGCHLVTAAGLRGLPGRARLTLVVAGVASLGVAVFPQPAHGSSAAHLGCAGVTMVLLTAVPFVAGRRVWPAGLVIGSVAVICLGWLVVQLEGGSWLGVAERAATTAQVLGPLVLAVVLYRHHAGTAASSQPEGR